jgi:hypothetical protein
MKLQDTFTEEGYDVSVESNTDTSFTIKIDDIYTMRVFKDEWEQIKKFIDDSIDFIDNH